MKNVKKPEFRGISVQVASICILSNGFDSRWRYQCTREFSAPLAAFDSAIYHELLCIGRESSSVAGGAMTNES